MTCPACRAEVAPGAFCSACGTALRVCDACGAANVASAAECAVCGAGAPAPPATAAAVPVAAPARAAARVQPTPAPPAPRAARAATAAPPAPPKGARGGRGALVGVARAVSTRTETEPWGNTSSSTTVVSFRLDRYDDKGTPLPPVPVEMRGRKFRGSVNDGDWVEVDGRWKPGTLVEPRRVRNLTTDSWVETKKRRKAVAAVLSIVAFLVIAGLMFYWFFESDPGLPVLDEGDSFGMRSYAAAAPR